MKNPFFNTSIVYTMSAFIATFKILPLFPCKPDGISIETIYLAYLFIISITSLNKPSMFLFNPTPNNASTT